MLTPIDFNHQGMSLAHRALAWTILLLLASTVVGGPLRVVFHGERHVLLVGIAALSMYLIWREGLQSVRTFLEFNSLVALPFLFFLGLLIWVAIPAVRSPEHARFALLDAQSLIMLPVTSLAFLALRKHTESLRGIIRITLLLCAFLAFAQAVIWIYLRVSPLPHESIYALVEVVFGTTESISIIEQPSNEGSYWRVVWISSYWLIGGIFLTPVFVKNRYAVFILQFLFGVAILASYTRGIWLGLALGSIFFIAVSLTLVKFRRRPQLYVPWVISAAALMASLLFVLSLDSGQGRSQLISARLYSSDVSNSINVKDESAIERVLQTEMLLKKWRERPLMGHGFGAYVESHFSHDERPFLYEMLPVALLMKMGAVGFFLYLLVLLFVLVRLLLLSARADEALALGAGYVAVLTQLHTNPVFFSFTGMLIFSMFLFLWLRIEVRSKEVQGVILAEQASKTA